MNKAATVDEYLACVESGDSRRALERLRAIIRDELPEAMEVISYAIPTYKLNGFVASFAAFRNHCSFFPGYTVRDFADQLGEFKLSKGTIQFQPDRPIPEDLVRAILRARVAENSAAKRSSE